MVTMKIAPGRSLLSPKGLLRSGTVIKAGEMGLTVTDIEHGVRTGFIVPVELTIGIVYETPPPATRSRDMTEDEAVHIGDRSPKIVVDGPAASISSSPSTQPPETVQKESLWDTDPASLKGKSLDDLLVMILDRDPNLDISTIDSVELAIEFLSQDFRPANKA